MSILYQDLLIFINDCIHSSDMPMISHMYKNRGEKVLVLVLMISFLTNQNNMVDTL